MCVFRSGSSCHLRNGGGSRHGDNVRIFSLCCAVVTFRRCSQNKDFIKRADLTSRDALLFSGIVGLTTGKDRHGDLLGVCVVEEATRVRKSPVGTAALFPTCS